MQNYKPREFWSRLARNFGQADEIGYAPVLHPGTPEWFNRAIDNLQTQTWNRIINRSGLPTGSRILDVGCGTGRWVRRYAGKNMLAAGIDQSLEMLRLARNLGTSAPLVSAEAQHLPFRDGSFDCVSSVTVVQHIPYGQQRKALSEMLRVLRPNGYLILVELIHGQGLHVFSRPPDEWIEQVTSLGAMTVFWEGHEYLFADRSYTHLVQWLRRLFGGAIDAESGVPLTMPMSDSANASFARRRYWSVRRAAVALSMWSEPLVRQLCRRNLATHAAFVFQKT